MSLSNRDAAYHHEQVAAMPKDADFRALLGQALLAAGVEAAAQEEARKALEIDPRVSADHRLKAAALAQSGDTEGALRSYDELLRIHSRPGVADVRVTLGRAYERKGARHWAEEPYRTSLRYVPDDQSAIERLRRIGRE